MAARTTAQRVWKVPQALGDIAFSFPYAFVLIEIQVAPPLRSQRHYIEHLICS